MVAVQKLEDLLHYARIKNPKRIVVAAANSESIINAIRCAVECKIVFPILIGNIPIINSLSKKCKLTASQFDAINVPSDEEASSVAVEMIYNNKADILMKGHVSTATLMRAVLKNDNKQYTNQFLSHFALAQIPTYHKLVAIADAAINIQPDMDDKIKIIGNSVEILHRLGHTCPKVAIVCPIEKENPKIVSTVHAAKIKSFFENGQLKGCIVDGPLALDNALSKESAGYKNIKSEVAGDADLLIAPNLDAGNILYKSVTYMAGGLTAAIVTGAKAPIVLTSRSDSELCKLYSIALAACL